MKNNAIKETPSQTLLKAKGVDENLGLPNINEFEKALLGALLCDGEQIRSIDHFLRPDHFYSKINGSVFQAMIELNAENIPIDPITVSNKLIRNGVFTLVNGFEFLEDLKNRATAFHNVPRYAEIVKEFSLKRDLVILGQLAVEEGLLETSDPYSLIDQLEAKVFAISQSIHLNKSKTFLEIVTQSILTTRENVESGTKVSGLTCGLKNIDRITHGFHKTDLIIIAARPGMSKTALVVQMILNISKTGVAAGFFSLEMNSSQLILRMQSSEAEIEHDKLRNNQLAVYELNRLVKISDELKYRPIYLDDTPAMTLGEIRSKARALVSKNKIEILFIDYLQLIKSESNNPNREQVIGEISRGLKALAKELNIPVIAISSLSRACEARADKRPILSDLRESGSIESDADIVMFLYRDEYYKILQDSAGESTEGVTEVIIAKHRNGSLDTVKETFVGKFQKYIDPEQDPF